MNQEIIIIGTGGTIAGKGSSTMDMNNYVAGSLPLEEILKSVPNSDAYGPYRHIQLCNIDSSNMTVSIWLKLLRTIEEECAKDSVAGVVVLHGTDTMEEGSYFLHLAAQTEKPIVLTGAMRPATALSPDGPINLLNAIQFCRSPQAKGVGVTVIMNGCIHGAREITKKNTTNLDAFGTIDFGHLGVLQEGKAFLTQKPACPHTVETPFKVSHLDRLPRVELLYTYGDIGADIIEAYSRLDLDGLVLVGMGHGILPDKLSPILAPLREKGVVIVRASRTGAGPVTALPIDDEYGYIPSATLPPLKARILLMLALAVTKDKTTIRDYIERF